MIGRINLTNYQINHAMTNLLEILLDKKRQTIKNIANKKKLDLSDYQQVSDFIKSTLK
jgi:hypothetical protein